LCETGGHLIEIHLREKKKKEENLAAVPTTLTLKRYFSLPTLAKGRSLGIYETKISFGLSILRWVRPPTPSSSAHAGRGFQIYSGFTLL